MFQEAIKAPSRLDADVLEATTRLEQDGYIILDGLVDPARFDLIRSQLDPHFAAAPNCTGPFFGETTRRFGSVLARAPEVEHLALHPLVMGVVDAIVGRYCESVQLSLTQGIEIFPGAPVQVPHRDHDMWYAPKGDMEYMINVMWALDDFTAENGATRIWPGSNRMDQTAMLPEDQAIPAVMPRGSVCLFLGSVLHSGGANRSALPRRGLLISYCQGWLKPWENQWLAYPPEIARTFSPELAALVGYRQHLPSLGNYEGQCPSVLLRQDKDWTPFVDALREDQFDQIRQYYEVLSDAA